MNATRKQRLCLVIGVLAAAALAVTLIVFALQRNMSYLFTPSQVRAGAAAGYQQFRLGGMVKAGSIQRAADSLKVSFTVIDKNAATPVEYTGILPTCSATTNRSSPTGACRAGALSPTKYWPSTTKPTCRRS